MALIGIKVPEDIAEKLSKIKVPGKKENPEKMHITMFYFEKLPSIEEAAKTCICLFKTLKKVEPFKVSIKNIFCFPENSYGAPVVCKVESEDLLDLRNKIKRSLDKDNIAYSDKYPEYKPHVTLSYANKPIDDFKIDKISWKVEELVLWAGEDYDDGMSATFTLNKKKTASEQLSTIIDFYNKFI